MVKCCCKCGRSNKKDKDVTIFSIPARNKSSEWQMEFVKRLGLENVEDKDIHICSLHFNPEDIELKDYMWTLKDNALPVENDAEVEEEMIVRPEVVYLKCDDGEQYHDSSSDCGEGKELVSLEPLVEYVYEEDEDEEQNRQNARGEAADGVEGLQDSGAGVSSEYDGDGNESQVISIVSSEGNNLAVEPMMPFFLTSSPVFTILNENNEVGETIILQIENSETEKNSISESGQVPELQSSCRTKAGSIIGEYTCDICDSSYGCLNCLKSHYESLHIASAKIQYKCKYSCHISKSLVCPVCDLMFSTRSETMDHYITHSVACEICGSGFDRQSYLIEHHKTAHPKTHYESSYECELCKTGYQYPGSLAKHYQTFHRMVLCHVCKQRTTKKIHREKLNVLPFACSKCDKAFPRISDIAVHIRMDHKRESGEQVVCDATPNVTQTPLPKRVKVKK
ncbi:hypothetical protein NQ318_012169 [Aromia moschata]|uniref:Uncharacterized protein n=1 Tax=Aromia moschata TaxID=1265417 RepID=A0AAV8YZF6_9CUCU|nr:hypothetical protein NQ318_012169 [Aromia moschata]